MNYKIMSTLLLSMIGYFFANATGRDPRIAELESLKIEIQNEVVRVSSEAYEAKVKLTNQARAMLMMYTGPIDKNDKNFIPKKFNDFVLYLSYQFDAGEDIRPLIDKSFREEEGLDIHLMCVKMIVQQLVVDRITNQSRDLAKKLESTNKELRILYDMSANRGF